MYQLTSYSDDNFADKVAREINKDYRNVAQVQRKIVKTSFQEPVFPTGYRYIPVGAEVSACFITDQHLAFCEAYVKSGKCKIKPEVVK